MPCCYDALSARLIERSGFPLAFMSGFSVAAAHGHPDAGLLSLEEVLQTLRSITSAVSIPIVADGDTGFGGIANVQRTVKECFKAGAAGLLIEDQTFPKRCGHKQGKDVVPREEAMARISAALDAARECGAESADGNGPVVIARTDAGVHDFDEAITRARLFSELGADVMFVEAPTSRELLRRCSEEVPGLTMANMLEMGHTPIVPPKVLEDMGFKIAAYPLTMISAAVKAQECALKLLKEGKNVDGLIKSFDELCEIVGFPEFYRVEEKYSSQLTAPTKVKN